MTPEKYVSEKFAVEKLALWISKLDVLDERLKHVTETMSNLDTRLDEIEHFIVAQIDEHGKTCQKIRTAERTGERWRQLATTIGLFTTGGAVTNLDRLWAIMKSLT